MHAGGSCGYGNSVSQAPFSSMVTGIGPSLYKSGKECGACYQVRIKLLKQWWRCTVYVLHYLFARAHKKQEFPILLYY